jgi:asparagine synthase (glutamine-hydrolysing)
VLVAWDGRLDNRGELVRRLGTAPPAASDAELVAAAYRLLGERCLDLLAGDFALAVWDPRARALVLARDPFGSRPLYYAERRGAVAWASTLRALFAAWPDLAAAPDAEWIAGWLTGDEPEDRTAYDALRAVPPGAAVVFAGGRRRVLRTWPPAELPAPGVASDRDAEERFRELFTDAVRNRLRAAGPAFCELSGGVDSSSIACAADRLLRDGDAAAAGLETVSWVFDRAATSDERAWIRPVEAKTGRRGHHLREEDDPLFGGFEDAWFEIPAAYTVFHLRHRRMGELMRRAGCRLLLSGVGGDSVVWSEYFTPPQLADLAAAGRFAALAREMRRWQRATALPYGKLLWDGVARPLLREAAGLSPEPAPGRIPWLGAALARRRGARDPAPDRPAAPRLPRPSQRRQLAAVLTAARRQVAPAYLEAELMAAEIAYPFLDRPLVEFCLALPAEQFARPGETRSLHRRALRGLLPPEIAERRNKRGPDEALIRRLGEAWPRLTAMFTPDARVFEHGFVERAPFLESLRRKRFGLLEAGGSVESVIALEVWLRGLERLGGSRLAA